MRTTIPILRNLHVGQVLYGVVATFLAIRIWEAFAGGAGMARGTFLLLVGLVVATFLFAVYLGNMYRFGVVPDYAETCEWCGGPVNSYSEFCEHCGADLVYDETVECPSCGVESYAGTRFCPECGGRLPEVEAPEPDARS